MSSQETAELLGQIVVVIGGSAGIGLETARRAREKGANVIVTGRDRERLERAASELGALRSAAFDATDPAALDQFFRGLPTIDHVIVTAGRPHYARLVDKDCAAIRRALDDHLLLMLEVARDAAPKVRAGGSLVFVGGTGARLDISSMIAAFNATLPALTANMALELAPMRVNLIAGGFADTPMSAALLDAELENRRDELRAIVPVGRRSLSLAGSADVAALAVHIMIDTTLTGATYDIDGGQLLVA